MHCAKPMATDKLASINWRAAGCGAPILDDCLAWLDCRVVATHVVGDHTLFIGEVVAGGANSPAGPLVYWNADYQRLE